VCPYQHKFENTYLYGAFSPINGDSFLLELPYCETNCFQLFLDELSKYNPKELKVVVLDNGSFHKSKKLIVPENIILIFLPAYSPELNPAEQIWEVIKKEFVGKSFHNIQNLSMYLTKMVRKLINKPAVKSICSYNYLLCVF